jgi:hypothetical protein
MPPLRWRFWDAGKEDASRGAISDERPKGARKAHADKAGQFAMNPPAQLLVCWS